MRIIGVIPARMGSTRFPGKPLATIAGTPMLELVFRRAKACALLSEVVIATCDQEIACAAGSFGAKAVMTSDAHERASDRVAEVSARDSAEIVVMIQGDEPLVRPEMIESAVTTMLKDATIGCVNLANRIHSVEELQDVNAIKTVVGRDGRALYFSRQPIPSICARPFAAGVWLKQVCVIPFRRDTLASFATLPRGPLEELESIDMLRFLENGLPVQVVLTDVKTHAVDVPGDVSAVETLLARNPWPAIELENGPA